MSVDVGKTSPGLMEAWVRGSTIAAQGLYKVTNVDWTVPTASTYGAQLTVTVAANTSGNPRLDIVVMEIADSQHAGSSNLAQIRVVTGTADAGATLDTRTGAAAVPASAILLADVIVANGAASIVTANIRDRRAFPLLGTVPPLLTDVDMVSFVPHAGAIVLPGADYGTVTSAAHVLYGLSQVACLMYLPRRIVGATRVRWRYLQGATANAGNGIIAIYDASGTFVAATAATAFAGAANVRTEASWALTAALTAEAGAYYVFFGFGTATASSTMFFNGVVTASFNSISIGPLARNLQFYLATGGTTLPAAGNILGMADTAGNTSALGSPSVPIIALSVG